MNKNTTQVPPSYLDGSLTAIGASAAHDNQVAADQYLRQHCLKLAQNDGVGSENVIAQAGHYFDFIKGEQAKAPIQETDYAAPYGKVVGLAGQPDQSTPASGTNPGYISVVDAEKLIAQLCVHTALRFRPGTHTCNVDILHLAGGGFSGQIRYSVSSGQTAEGFEVEASTR